MKNKCGISLIVLIVTIIVIIILAAVVILTISKNNPIESAKEAKFKEDVRTFQDELALSVSKDYAAKAGARDYKFKATRFEKIQKYIPSFNKNYDKKFVIKEDSLVYNEEKLSEKELEYVTSLNINKNIKTCAEKVEDNPNSYYGEVIQYQSGNSDIDSDITEWKIFYSNGDNIYIISSDRVNPANLPETKKNKKKALNANESIPKSAEFSNILSEYTGSSDITDERIKELNSDFFNKGYVSTNNNMKAVAYMLDIDIWSKFVNEKVADYAIGGPTVEMFLNSYCQKYPDKDYKAKAVSEIGYWVSDDGGKEGTWKSSIAGGPFQNDNLYSWSGSKRIIWLATPIDKNANGVYSNYYNTIYAFNYNMNNIGFCPVICLKSNIDLNPTQNGFEIVE